MFPRWVPLILGVVLLAACARMPQVELEIARSEVARAYASGAKVLAPEEYVAASTALHDAEVYVSRGKYGEAREVLTKALLQATKATELALQKAEEIAAQQLREEEAARKAAAAKKKKKVVVKKKAPPKSKPTPKPPKKPVIVMLDEVTVSKGETLFSLAGRKDIYADALLWPLIYRANRDQIKDPLHIFEGQVFSVPRDKSKQEQELARKEALDSGLFRP